MSVRDNGYLERKPATNEALVCWIIAAAISAVALIGFVSFVVAIMFFLSFPEWLETVIAIGLVTGFCLYTWTLAKAWAITLFSRRMDHQRAGS